MEGCLHFTGVRTLPFFRVTCNVHNVGRYLVGHF
jgi:hypothetical protein